MGKFWKYTFESKNSLLRRYKKNARFRKSTFEMQELFIVVVQEKCEVQKMYLLRQESFNIVGTKIIIVLKIIRSEESDLEFTGIKQ